MLAWRTTWHVKPGMMDKALELLDIEVKRLEVLMQAEGYEMHGEARAYVLRANHNVLVLEINFETEAENEEFWALNNRQSEARRAFMEQWAELTDGREEPEMWELHTDYFQSVKV